MDLKLLKRRVEMLDAVSTGLHPSAVVGQLAEKYGVSERCLWSNWERRAKWVPVLLELEKYGDFADVIEQKLNAVQKAAWSIYLQADNDNARVGALKVVLDCLEVHSDVVLSRDILERLERVEELAEKKVVGEAKILNTVAYFFGALAMIMFNVSVVGILGILLSLLYLGLVHDRLLNLT